MRKTLSIAITSVIALLFLLIPSRGIAESVGYEGTATLCFISATPPIVEFKGPDPENPTVTLVDGVVSLYQIETDHPLVNGWEVLSLEWKITPKWTFLTGLGVFTPDEYIGTESFLTEDMKIKTNDLSTFSGVWHGTGELEGISVDYELVLQSDPTPVCPNDPPPQCEELGGCLPAVPPFAELIVYDMSGFVTETE